MRYLSITSVAREMAGALTVSATFVLNLVIIAVAHPRGSWLTLLTVWAQPTEVSPERRLPSRTTNNTHVRHGESNIEVFNMHGNGTVSGYLVESVVLTFGTHVQ